jgi:hypothetical protein
LQVAAGLCHSCRCPCCCHCHCRCAAAVTVLLPHSQCTCPGVRAAAAAAVDPCFVPLSLAGRRWAVPQLPLCQFCHCRYAAAVLKICTSYSRRHLPCYVCRCCRHCCGAAAALLKPIPWSAGSRHCLQVGPAIAGVLVLLYWQPLSLLLLLSRKIASAAVLPVCIP